MRRERRGCIAACGVLVLESLMGTTGLIRQSVQSTCSVWVEVEVMLRSFSKPGVSSTSAWGNWGTKCSIGPRLTLPHGGC